GGGGLRRAAGVERRADGRRLRRAPNPLRGDHRLEARWLRRLPRPTSAPHPDRLIQERIRLGIVSALAVNEHLTFNDLKRLLKTTDGNLSVHARKLEEAEYIACDKPLDGGVTG